VTRSRKIIEILEGFKLGSLGAGLKKPIYSDEPEDLFPVEQEKTDVDIIETGETVYKKDDGSKGGLPYIFWRESSGYKYLLHVVYRKIIGHYYLQLACGKKLGILDGTGDVSTGFMREDWTALSPPVSTLDEVTLHFRILVGKIQQSSMSSKFLRDFDIKGPLANYRKWLKQGKKIKT
jgi:hypothetical protein